MTDDQWREMKDELLNELVNIRIEVEQLRSEMRDVFNFPVKVEVTSYPKRTH